MMKKAASNGADLFYVTAREFTEIKLDHLQFALLLSV